MVDLAEIQAAYYMVAATGVLVAAAYYVYNMNATRKTQEHAQKTQELMLKSQEQTLETRQTQLFMQIYMRYLESDLFGGNYFIVMHRQWSDSSDYSAKYGDNQDGGNLTVLMTFFEGIAVLIKRGVIDIDLVYELMPTNVTALWHKYEPLIASWRKSIGAPNLYYLVGYLSDTIGEYAKKRGDPKVTEYGESFYETTRR
jgi:hypothetical protein